MLFEYLKHKELLCLENIEETFDSVRVKLKPDEPMASFVPKLFDEIKSISSRDHFELFFDVSGNHVKITDCSSFSYGIIEDHIGECNDEDEYELDLIIKKSQENNTLSIYFLNSFAEYIDQESSVNLIRSVSNYFHEYLNFEVFSTVGYFGSNTIVFFEASNSKERIANNVSVSREDKLNLLFENSSVTNLSLKLIPSDFYLLNDADNEKINIFFRKLCSALSLIFISNSSEFMSDGKLSYKITGYKSIANDGIELRELLGIHKLLFRIYSWAFEGGNSSDKIGLVRNVLSIHLDETGCIKFDQDVWEAIQSNYQIYLKGNVQAYLEIKNKIGEFIIESTAKTYAMADELLDSLKNYIFILLTFILTVVVVNGLKDNGEVSVFSNVYLAIVLILSLVSAIWLWMTKQEIINRFDSATKTVKRILLLNYNKVLMESEINECVDPVIKENREYLNTQLKRYSKWWVILLVVFVLSFISANRYFLPDTENEDAAAIKSSIDVQDEGQKEPVVVEKKELNK